jgi:hypothetical protein
MEGNVEMVEVLRKMDFKLILSLQTKVPKYRTLVCKILLHILLREICSKFVFNFEILHIFRTFLIKKY